MFLTCNNLDFEYTASRPVLDSVSINVAKGEFLSLVGASGSGKSTLLRIIAGILPNSRTGSFSGTVRIAGANPNDYRKHGRLSFMFQEPALLPNLSVFENVRLPLQVKHIRDDQRIHDLIEAVGLSSFSNFLPAQLSGGMKTRVALARSFATGPELLLLDEPFTALDISWKSRLYVELETLRQQFGTSVVMVTHDCQEALALSDEVVVLSQHGHIKERHRFKREYTAITPTTDVLALRNDIISGYLSRIQMAIISDADQFDNPPVN